MTRRIPWPGSASGGGPGGSSTRGGIFVGNVLNGDTSTSCNFLDPGDGTGIIAAMAWATANPTYELVVCIAAGPYTLAAGAPLIVVPSNVKALWGAGPSATIITGVAASGVSPQIFRMPAGTEMWHIGLVSPVNVAGEAASADVGLIGVGQGCRFFNCTLGLTISASVAHPAPYGFAYYSATAPSGIVFENCHVTFTGDNATGSAFGVGFLTQSSGTISAAPAKPVEYRNCSVTALGASGGITGIYTDPTFLYSNISSVGCKETVVFGHTSSTTLQGPSGDGLLCDSRAMAASTTVTAAICTATRASGSPALIGTSLRGVVLLGSTNMAAASKAVSISASGTMAMSGITIEATSRCTVAGSGGVTVAADAGATTNVAIVANVGTGDISLTTNAGSITDATVTSPACRNVSVGAGAVRTRLEGIAATGTITLTAGATDTVLGVGTTWGTLTDNTTAGQRTVYARGKVRTITADDAVYTADDCILCNLGAASALFLDTAANLKGRQFAVRDIAGNFNARNLTITPASGQINGAATLVCSTNNQALRITSDGSNFWTL